MATQCIRLLAQTWSGPVGLLQSVGSGKAVVVHSGLPQWVGWVSYCGRLSGGTHCLVALVFPLGKEACLLLSQATQWGIVSLRLPSFTGMSHLIGCSAAGKSKTQFLHLTVVSQSQGNLQVLVHSAKKCVLVTVEAPSGGDSWTPQDFWDCMLQFLTFSAVISNYSKTLVLKSRFSGLGKYKNHL